MFVVVLIGTKGGSGRSTLARALASAGVARGLAVQAIDLDPDRALLRWAERVAARGGGAGEGEHFAVETAADVDAALDLLAVLADGESADLLAPESAAPDLVVIDTRGLMGEALEAVMLEADALVMPVIPNETDIRVQWQSFEVYQSLMERIDDNAFLPPFAALLARFPGRPSLYQREARALIEAAFTVLGPVMHDRTPYARMDSEGLLPAMLRNGLAERDPLARARARHVVTALEEAASILDAVLALPET